MSNPGLAAWIVYVLASSAVLYVFGARVLSGLAQRHKDVDPAAPRRMVVALVAGLVLGGGGWVLFDGVERGGADGIHASFSRDLSTAVGETAYQDALSVTNDKPGTILIQESKLAEAEAALASLAPGTEEHTKAAEKRDGIQSALALSREELAKAHLTVARLTPNHDAWGILAPRLDARDIAGLEALLHDLLEDALVTDHLPAHVACVRGPDATCQSPLVAQRLQHTSKDAHLHDVPIEEAVEGAFHVRSSSLDQMSMQLWIFVYPGITGLLIAPMIFAGGRILSHAFVPSDTVGFRKYPGKSMGWFLILGAFGVLATPFAGWALWDLSRRSREGQIAL